MAVHDSKDPEALQASEIFLYEKAVLIDLFMGGGEAGTCVERELFDEFFFVLVIWLFED